MGEEAGAGVPLSACDQQDRLPRELSLTQLLGLGVGAIIGAGIFVATGVVAANNAGPAVVLSLALASLACLAAALCYAEFATIVPSSGGAYSFVRAAFGPLTGWVVGWCLVLEYLMAGATVAVGWSGYCSNLLATLGVEIPPWAITPTFGVAGPGLRANLLAAAITVGVYALLARGARLSAAINLLLVAIKITAIGGFIIVGAAAIDPDHWSPFIPPSSGQFGHFGWSGVLRGAAAVYYAFLGFDTIATAAREARNAPCDLPAAIIGSVGICTIIYVLFALVLTGIAPFSILGTANPVATALDYAGPRLSPLKIVISFGALVGLTSVLVVVFFAQSRVLLAMSEDRLVPAALGKLDRVTRAPRRALMLSGLIIVTASALFPVSVLGDLISIGTLTAFCFVCGGILVLRSRQPGTPRGFTVPFARFTCVSGLVICSVLIAALPTRTWIAFTAWLALGTAYYGARRRWIGRTCPSMAPKELS